MNFCYCVGGTGARVAEVAAHLCAMNLVDDQDITFVIVDKDATCGGTDQARKVIDSVAALAAVNTDKGVALSRSTVINPQAAKEFCKADLIVENWDFTKALEAVAPQGITGAASLEASMSSTNHMLRESDGVLLDAFYSDDEQKRDTSQGFYGHPSIGALIFKYMIKNGGWNNPNVSYGNDIAAPVKKFINDNPAQTARVFVIGSIFGGTGASIFSNLAYHIRNSVKDADKNRILISGVLLLPYFTFTASNDALVDPTEFYAKSTVALRQYANDASLLKNAANPGGSFDSLYICGQEPLHTVAPYCHGGANQSNHFNFVDLAAAKSMTEFFSKEAEEVTGGKIFEYRLSATQDAALPSIDLSNAQDLHKPLVAMLTFSAFVITRIYGAFILRENDPYNNNLIRMIYGTDMNEGVLKGHRPTQEYTQVVKDQVKKTSALVFGYCSSYIRFLRDIAANGHDWSETNLNSHDQEYNFLNKSYLDALHDIIKLIDNEAPDIGQKINAFIKRGDYIPNISNGLSAEAIEKAMQDIFNNAPAAYKRGNISVDERIADYIHEVFKFCYAHA